MAGPWEKYAASSEAGPWSRYAAPTPEEAMPGFADVLSNSSTTATRPITLEQMQKDAAENESPEQRVRRIMEEGESQGAGMALRNAPLALGGIAASEVAGARLLPFLMRLGAGARGAGATAGAGGS